MKNAQNLITSYVHDPLTHGLSVLWPQINVRCAVSDLKLFESISWVTKVNFRV